MKIIKGSLRLGETSLEAYRGDRGKTAYDHSQVTSGNPHSVTKSDISLDNVKNIDWGDVLVETDSYELTSSDNGKVITVNSALSKVITIPDSLNAEFSCMVVQLGAGEVSFTASGSMSIRNRQSHTKVAGQYGTASLYVYAANNVLLQGDTTS